MFHSLPKSRVPFKSHRISDFLKDNFFEYEMLDVLKALDKYLVLLRSRESDVPHRHILSYEKQPHFALLISL